MAPPRRRSPRGSPNGKDGDAGRSPKAKRLSNGSGRSSSGSTTGSALTGRDEDEEEEEMDDGNQQGRRGKGKGKRKSRRNSSGNNSEEWQEEEEERKEEEEEEEAGQGGGEEGVGGRELDMAEKSKMMDRICRQAEEEEGQGAGGGGDGGDGADGEEEGGASGQANGGGASSKGKGGAGEELPLKKRTSQESEAGVILKINLHHFMCHKRFEIKLCKQVNFINGRNGSGKSAILAALQICLGAKANFTHRAKKLSDFIRHGWEGDAVVQVTLLNNSQGYKFDEYGESITVKRTIKQPSGGGFALIGHDGQTISRERSELTKMLDMLNIQVDNPCAVLDQENSKKFLQGSEKDKYAFFMKATDLDRVLTSCEETGEKITEMTIGHHQAIDQLPQYQKIMVGLQEEWREYLSLDRLLDKVARWKEELAWSIVGEEEEKVADRTEDVAVKESEIKRLKSAIIEIDEQLAGVTARKEESKARIAKGVAELVKRKAELEQAGSELSAANGPLLSLRGQRTNLQAEQRKKKDAKRRASAELKDAREQAKRKASDQKEKNLYNDIQQVEDKLSHLSRMRGDLEGEEAMYELRRAATSAQEAADKTKQDYEIAQKELNARKTDLRNLDTEAFNPLTALGGYMPGLVKMIAQNANKFRTPPVGPIGASIQLKEECQAYRVCIEGHLGGFMNSFVVSCQQDKTSLVSVMKSFRQSSRGRNWPLPSIIVQSAIERHSPPQNPRGFLQIMQAVNVTDDQAFNALLDQCAIEKTCLFPSKDDAERACLVGASGNYQRMPHGMFEAYYPCLGGRSCSRFSVSDGNIQTRMNVVNADRHRSVLGVDAGTQREEAEALVQQAETAVQSARQAADHEARTAKATGRTFGEAEEKRSKLASQEGQLNRQKQKLDNQLLALKAANNASTDPTEELERALENASEALETVETELATMEGQMREVAAQIEPLKEAKKAAHASHQEATKECEKMSRLFEEEGAGESKQQQLSGRAKARLAKAEEELKDRSAAKEKAVVECKIALEKSEKFMTNVRRTSDQEWDGLRTKSRYNTEQLKHKITVALNKYEKERQSRNIRGKSKEEVRKQLHSATAVFREKSALAERLESNIITLAAEKRERMIKWKLMRKYVARKTSGLFNKYLQEKGASGEVIFDYENGLLGLTYQKDSSNDDSQCSDVKLLSGGERSFATLALLLALGAGHECPFRVMDEFDVFMDAMSRNIAMKQVINFAKNSSQRQFILITPQDLSSVTPTDTCRIHKMLAPRSSDHGQMTLDDMMGGDGGAS